eukprot:Rhum_TRINITY_DN14749_c16_g1::Rhum_TRINITY_DN14749_c16_g1_i1::g.116668::m.116668
MGEGCVCVRCGGFFTRWNHASSSSLKMFTRSWPPLTIEPSFTSTRSTTPFAVALIFCSIFIASSTTRSSPTFTSSPTAAITFVILPGIGADTRPPDDSAVTSPNVSLGSFLKRVMEPLAVRRDTEARVDTGRKSARTPSIDSTTRSAVTETTSTVTVSPPTLTSMTSWPRSVSVTSTSTSRCTKVKVRLNAELTRKNVCVLKGRRESAVAFCDSSDAICPKTPMANSRGVSSLRLSSTSSLSLMKSVVTWPAANSGCVIDVRRKSMFVGMPTTWYCDSATSMASSALARVSACTISLAIIGS